MDEDIQDVGRRVAKGAGWTVFMRFSVRAIGLVSTLILARLLVPGDFGLVALATMLAGILSMVSGFNFSVFLIREPNLDRSHYDTAWTLAVLRGLIISILLAVGASFTADFFDEPRLRNIIYALSAATAVGCFANVGIIDFQKSMNFRKDFQFFVSARIVSFLVTVSLAIILRNYWALVCGILSGRLVRFLLSYWMHPFRPRPSLARAGEILHFSKWMLANNILGVANNRSDTFVIGKFLDAATLGLYSVAHEIATLASAEILAPIHRALLPGLSTLTGDPRAMRRAFINSQAVIILIAMPATAGIALVADPLVWVALGEKWTAAIPLIQILAIVGVMRVCSASTSSFILATGRPQLLTIMAGSGAVISILSLLWATANWGVIGAAWAVSATAMFQLGLTYFILLRAYRITPREILSSVWRPTAGCVMMSAAVTAIFWLWPHSDTATVLFLLLKLLLASAVGASFYVAVILFLWKVSGAPNGAEISILKVLKKDSQERAVTPMYPNQR